MMEKRVLVYACFVLFSLFLLASVSAVSCGVLNEETPVSAGLTFSGLGTVSNPGATSLGADSKYGGDAWQVKDTKGSAQISPNSDTYWKSKSTGMFSANSCNREI